MNEGIDSSRPFDLGALTTSSIMICHAERSSEANKGSLTAESKHPYKRHLFMSSSCAVQLRGNKRTSTQEPAKQIVPDPRNPTENIITDAP